ncbi:transglycosylase domain-containing protein [Actinomadura viridis]|uniref:Membrane peptidoglycan carboxypeptidase n=1 Tax=Actinomadura viridis TaxID=58110 RepID=A0A931DGH2_9ACTN|nr:transglycosylase domain-containing protein [Actinomadura viridis]MBG6087121.1 membrane peptidoglycan carboxypeptidase [Actinomadura viridis]
MLPEAGERAGDPSSPRERRPDAGPGGTGIWRAAGEGPPAGGRTRALRGLGGFGVLAGVLVALIILPVACTAGVGARDAADWFQSEPEGLDTGGVPQRSRILAADGSTLATFYYENRVDVRLDQVAPVVRRAVLAIEDSRFYEHGALDSQGTLRALVSNLGSGEVTQGGSGITQQYVKNLLFTQAESEEEQLAAKEVSAARKIRELRYAVALERRLSKDEILARYLNIAYFGGGAYGIESAARHFFSKPASRLTLPEAALLAGVIRYPYAYDPVRRPAAARARRDVVLGRMAELGWITRAEADAALRRPLGLRVHNTPNGCVTSFAPFFCDYVQREILTNPVFGATRKERERLLKRGGLTIRTTLDRQTQRAAQRAVDRHVPRKNSARKAAAEALVEPGTGEIKGLVVGRRLGSDRERGKTWINFAADAGHGSSIGMQAGSTFKAFTLAAALEDDMPFGTRLMAPRGFVPTGFRDCRGRPVNSTTTLRNSADGEGGRTFSLVTGTHHSVNTFFLALEREVGLCETVKMAERLGMRRADGKPMSQFPSFTLGADQVSPLRLAAAYAAFGARGRYCEPIAIKQITDASGRRLRVPGARCRQAIDKGVADAVNHVLRGVLTKGTARGMGLGRPAAGKTGTVDDFSAAWFAGYTPDLAAAVWVGDPRGGYRYPMTNVCMDGRCYGPVFGATIPAPIWRDSMVGALAGRPATGFHRAPGRYFSKGSGEDRVDLPDVRGMPVREATARLRAAGFQVRVGGAVPSAEYPRGTVAEMTPGPGRAEPGTTVTLRPSEGGGDEPGEEPGSTPEPDPGNGGTPVTRPPLPPLVPPGPQRPRPGG